MRESRELSPLTTRVGRADWGDNRYRGYGVLAELAGHDGFWSMISLAVGGPRLDDGQSRLLDDLATCTFAGDPRIWPLKIVRVVGSFGQLYPALCAGMLPMQHAQVGFADVQIQLAGAHPLY